MKADQNIQFEVTQTLKGMFEAYKKKDLKGVLSYWAPDPDILIIGSGVDERGIGTEELAKSLKRDWAQADVVAIGVKDFRVSSVGGVAAWFGADLTFTFKMDEKEVAYPGRLTGVMEKRKDKWLWAQMHFSTPSNQQEAGQSWPKPQ